MLLKIVPGFKNSQTFVFDFIIVIVIGETFQCCILVIVAIRQFYFMTLIYIFTQKTNLKFI